MRPMGTLRDGGASGGAPVFPAFYRQCLYGAATAREVPVLPGADPRWTERHLQCVWYDARWRPARLLTVEGEALEVRQPGRWNLEAGPDFRDAELCVGPAGRRLRGDVEVHVRPTDWERHRHGADARYADVVLHVTYYPGPTHDPRLPPHILRVALRDELVALRSFAFEDIDLAAYPHAILPRTPRPCGTALAALPPPCGRRLLESAGHHRLQAKAARMAERLRAVGDRRQVFYEEVMAVLGYKHNSAGFRRVAERLPLAIWSAVETVDERYARLLGAAGLLPTPATLRDPAARTYARALWDAWFRNGGGAVGVADDVRWTLGGVRPTNHPVRRLAAAAALFHRTEALLEALSALPLSDPPMWFRGARALIADCPAPSFWERRPCLHSVPGPRPLALLGAGRIAAILTNAVVPLRLAETPAAAALLDALPSEDLGASARETAFHLFGRDHNPALYQRSGLLQQGLLAIHQDFCLNSREGCLGCPLAERLQETPADVP